MARKAPQKKSPRKKAAKKTSTKSIAAIEKERDLKDLDLPQAVRDDPRKSLFLRLYYDRESPTYGDMKNSALGAGFSAEYANNLSALRPKWISVFIGRRDFVALAEEHLKEVLLMPNITQAMGAFGPIEKTIIVEEDTGQVYKSGKKKGEKKMKKKKVKVPVLIRDISMIKEKTAAAKIVLPAHDPATYGKRDGPKVSFSYNVKEVRNRYQPSSP